MSDECQVRLTAFASFGLPAFLAVGQLLLPLDVGAGDSPVRSCPARTPAP